MCLKSIDGKRFKLLAGNKAMYHTEWYRSAHITYSLFEGPHLLAFNGPYKQFSLAQISCRPALPCPPSGGNEGCILYLARFSVTVALVSGC